MEKILTAVIQEYTETAVPVGSKSLIDKHGFHLSSATVRNDMARLEKEGYLFQPHTSAGRIPTDKGYRYFVEKVMGDEELSRDEQRKLQAEVLKLKAQNRRFSRTTSKLLASLSGSLAISGDGNDLYDFGIKELLGNPEFREIDEFCRVAEALDYIDENVEAILGKLKDGETKIFIGQENPIKNISNCSMVVSPYRTKEGEKGLLAIIGPKRMKYAKNKSLLEYVRNLLGASAFLLVLSDGSFMAMIK